jgi:AhpD family alkylhydroperoxidase
MRHLDYAKASPEGYRAMLALNQFAETCGLEPSLLKLIKIRASQLNGCAYCIDMHTKDARAHGETEQRLYALSAWRETPFFSERERAALAWTEAVTLVADAPIDEDDYDDVREHFDEKSLADLTLAIVAINGWNRLSIAFATVPGSYRRPAPEE